MRFSGYHGLQVVHISDLWHLWCIESKWQQYEASKRWNLFVVVYQRHDATFGIGINQSINEPPSDGSRTSRSSKTIVLPKLFARYCARFTLRNSSGCAISHNYNNANAKCWNRTISETLFLSRSFRLGARSFFPLLQRS